MTDTTFSFAENWTPPRELTRALPREMRISGRGKILAILDWGTLVAAIACFVAVRNHDERQAARIEALRLRGRETDGKITQLWHEGKASTPMVANAFTVNGVRIEGDAQAPRAWWLRMRIADALPVRFVASNPKINHPAAWEESADPMAPGFISGAVRALRCVHSLESEKAAAGGGRGCACGWSDHGLFRAKNGWVAHYQFHTKNGTVAKRRGQVFSKWEAGATVCVLYLSENPRGNQLYPACMYQVVTQ
jgi:hypothetical protein